MIIVSFQFFGHVVFHLENLATNGIYGIYLYLFRQFSFSSDLLEQFQLVCSLTACTLRLGFHKDQSCHLHYFKFLLMISSLTIKIVSIILLLIVSYHILINLLKDLPPPQFIYKSYQYGGLPQRHSTSHTFEDTTLTLVPDLTVLGITVNHKLI